MNVTQKNMLYEFTFSNLTVRLLDTKVGDQLTDMRHINDEKEKELWEISFSKL